MFKILISLLIGFLGLDTTIAFQVLISQPIFSCALLGMIFGDVQLGIEIGIMMQLLWLSIIPVGAAVFPEGNVGSMVTCAVALQFSAADMPNTVFTAAFVLGVAVSYLGAQITVIDRKFNERILDLALEAARSANLRKITLLDVFSVLVYFLMMSLLAYATLWVAELTLPKLLAVMPPLVEAKLAVVKPVIWGIGIAMTFPLLYRALRLRD